jgi:acyl-CoA hydrolase
MTTPIQQKIRDKKRTPAQILDMVKSGDWIQTGTTGGESTALLAELAGRLGPEKSQLRDIELWVLGLFHPRLELEKADPYQEYYCLHDPFLLNWSRKTRDKYGVTDWNHWGWSFGVWFWAQRFLHKVKASRGIDWWWNAATAPNQFGYFNFSYGTGTAAIYSQITKKIVIEVREDYPWAEPGRNNLIHIDDIDYWLEVDCEKFKWPQVNERALKPTDEEKKIAEHILTIMRDRDVIQLGIGGLPSAVATAIADSGLSDLGIHTEMLNYGLLNLIESGKVTNKYKNLSSDRGKSVWTFAAPFDSKWYYDLVHHNPSLAVCDSDYTNNYQYLTRIDNMIAIDNFMAIDLLGQVCCGFYNGRPISGTGGFFHFIVFCSMSRGGRGVATATSRSKHGTSRIVPLLPTGATVDVPAQFVSHVCTEYGLVNLRGLTGYERANALISIAHPDDRPELEKAAKELGLVAPKFRVDMNVTNGGRRYPRYDERRNFKIPVNSEVWGIDWDNGYMSGR